MAARPVFKQNLTAQAHSGKDFLNAGNPHRTTRETAACLAENARCRSCKGCPLLMISDCAVFAASSCRAFPPDICASEQSQSR